MSKLASLLGGMTLNDLAKEVLSLQGRRGDTELAHVNKREAALLKSQGGSGTINPNTGMTEFVQEDYFGPEFTEDYSGFAKDQSYMGTPTVSQQSPQVATVDVGQPTPTQAGGQNASPPQEISGSGIDWSSPESVAASPLYKDLYPGGLPGEGEATYFPAGSAAFQGAPSREQFRGAEDVLAMTEGAGITGEGEPAGPSIMDRLAAFEKWAKENPQLARGIGAAVGGIPGLRASRQARKDAERTRAEMERMAAPIRQTGEQLLSAGQRGELTAAQQQQIQAARAATRQDLARRGVTSGTAAQQAENRITELAQRFAQTNIDNGVRLIGAANSYNAQAIQMAYKMNADANALTQNYFTNLMRASGALPTETVTTTRTV